MVTTRESTEEDRSDNDDEGSGGYQTVVRVTTGRVLNGSATFKHITRAGTEAITGAQSTVTNTQTTDDSYSTRPCTDQPNGTSQINSTHLGRHATAEQIADDSYSTTRPSTGHSNSTSRMNLTHLRRQETAEPQQTGLAIGE